VLKISFWAWKLKDIGKEETLVKSEKICRDNTAEV
jgi:hypothetical protein